MSPEAHWIPFTAKTVIDSTSSSFRWDARIQSGGITSIVITDAYEQGHGRLVVKAAGLIPLKKMVGSDFDRGELQRYLASLLLCPAMLLHHPSLEWSEVDSNTLRLRDRNDQTGASVDFEISEDGCPTVCRADRPRAIGKHTVLTPWTGTAKRFREWEGLRVADQLEVAWHFPNGPFVYFHGEVSSFEVVT